MFLKKKEKIKKNKKDLENSGKQKISLWRYFLRFVFILVLILIIALILLWCLWQKPNSGAVHVLESPLETKEQITFERFEGEYLSFHHNSFYKLRSHEKIPDKNSIFLESAFLSSSASGSRKIALTVENLVGRTITDSANYNLRKSNPKLYAIKEYEAGDVKGITFAGVGTASYEKVIFIPREKYLVELAFTASLSPDSSLDQEFEDIIKSIQWKK